MYFTSPPLIWSSVIPNEVSDVFVAVSFEHFLTYWERCWIQVNNMKNEGTNVDSRHCSNHVLKEKNILNHSLKNAFDVTIGSFHKEEFNYFEIFCCFSVFSLFDSSLLFGGGDGRHCSEWREAEMQYSIL